MTGETGNSYLRGSQDDVIEQTHDGNEQLSSEIEAELQQSLSLFDFQIELPEKSANIMRFYYNNCNGMEINKTIATVLQAHIDKKKYNYIKDIEAPTKVDSIVRQMKVWNVDIVGLSETGVAWEDKSPRNTIQQITKKYDKTGCWTMSSSSVSVGNYLKPGGTGILTMNEYPGRIQDRGTDPWKMGRWSYITLSGKEESSKVTIITGYRVGKRSSAPGSSTAWTQQRTLLCLANRDEDPHSVFFTDLKTWLNQEKFRGNEILLFLDANERWDINSEIRKFADDMNLYNINETFQLQPTHPNVIQVSRSTTIDFGLASSKLMENITYASSTPYDMENLGDHRGILLDINIHSLLGKNARTTQVSSRKLVLSNPKAVDKYIKKVAEGFDKQNIVKRTQKLYKRVLLGHTDIGGLMRQYNQIDNEVFGICQKAEKLCRPTIAGRYDWSPKLAKGIKQLSYWRHRFKHNTDTPVVKKLGKELNILYINLSKTTLYQMVNDSYANLKTIQKEATKHRQEHLSELAEKYALQHNISQNTAVTELLSHEESRTVFGELKNKIKPIHRGQLKKLWISVDEEGNYSKDPQTRIMLSNKEQIHKELLKRNSTHLTQATNTPFAQGSLGRGLKWDGTGMLSDDILSGNILQRTKFSRAMQLYLESLQTNKLVKLNTVKPVLSFEEYKVFWKKKRENTVTSPYGLHIGHYKAAIMRPSILDVHRILLLIPFKLGMVPERWRRTVQTMLEKEPGSPWIHRLRIIELFDAQVNAGFQIFVGRNLIQQAVRSHALQMESYGSTPGKTAVGAVIQKMVSLDQLRLERRAGGIFDCDASGCYDRILPPLASVHLRALGLDKSIGTFLARFMFQAKRHVRTGHGISKKHIKTTKRKVLHGIGQGNGGGPAIWLSHLTVMLSAISTVCAGFTMYCIQKLKSISTVGTGYVDDVTLGLALPKEIPQTEATVRRHIRRMSQLWEQLLYISGGRLELSKCFWVSIVWRWNKGKPKMNSRKSRVSKDLFLRESETKDNIKIPQLAGKEAIKRLGIWTNCEATWAREFRNWKEYSHLFGQKIKYAKVGRIAGYQAYHAMWLAKFRFSAPVIGLKSRQVQKIKQCVVGPCLAAAGYCSKMPRAVVFGPSKYGGMDWDNPEGILVYEKIKALIGSIRLQDVVGRLLVIQMTWLQLHAGISTQILEYTKRLEYLPTGWIMNIHEYLVHSRIKIKLYGAWVPTKQRHEDRIIMDYVLHHTPPKMWGGINRCRLFLQGTTFADITTLDGQKIPTKVRNVKKAVRPNTLEFPYQVRPPDEDINHWKYFVDMISHNGRLHTPLGDWVRTPDQKFPFMKPQTEDTVYKSFGKRWKCFRKRSAQSRRYYNRKEWVDSLPQICVPVDVIELSQALIVKQREISTSTAMTTGHGLVSLSTSENWKDQVMGKAKIEYAQLEKLEIAWKSAECTIVCATDGGLKDTVGTSSYAFFLPHDTSPVIEGFSAEHQPFEEASSTRQELLGQLAVEYWIHELREKWGSPRSRLRLVLLTDSKSSIDIMKSIQNIIGVSATLKPEMDVALEIHSLQADNPWIERKVVKVTSHIDKDQAPDPFLWECNDRADKLATEGREYYSMDDVTRRLPPLFPGAKIGCVVNGRVENNNLYRILKDAIDGRNIEEYLCVKHSWNFSTFQNIVWTAHHRELNRFPKPNRATLIKYIHGWLATKKRRYVSGSFVDPKCPLCGNTETSQHMFQCAHEQMTSLRQTRWGICKTIVCKYTPNGVQQVFLEGLQHAFDLETVTDLSTEDWTNDLKQAYEAQQQIGWSQVYSGRLAKQWEPIVQENTMAESDVTQYRWTGKIIRAFWEYGLEVWKIRNTLVHGTTGDISNLEKRKVDNMIRAIYSDICPGARRITREFFSIPETDRVSQTYKSKKAWLESVRVLFPKQFSSLENSVVGRLQTEI